MRTLIITLINTYENEMSIYQKRLIKRVFLTFVYVLLLIFVVLPYVEFSKSKKDKTEQTEKNESTEETQQTTDKWQGKKRSGKNEPHKNQDVRERDQKQIDELSKQLEEMLKTKPADRFKGFKKACEDLASKIQKLKQKMKQKAETHGVKGKGYK